MEEGHNLSEAKKKLEKILWKLFEPTFKIKNDLYLNLLLTHWISKTGSVVPKSTNKQALDKIFLEWIIAATSSWNQKKNTPPTPVLSFALNVCSQLSTDEIFFNEMKNKNVYAYLAEAAKENQELDMSISVGLITVLTSVLEHPSGVQWLCTTSYWNDVVNTAQNGNTKYIKRKAYNFIIKLLETAVLHDKNFCEELVEILFEPLHVAIVQLEFTKGLRVEQKYMYESLKPSLDLISEVTDTLLKNFNKDALNIFVETEIPEAMQDIINFSENQDFSFDLLKIRFVFLFYNLYGKLEGNNNAAHNADTLYDIGRIFDLIKAEIDKEHVRCVIKSCYYAHVLYCNLDNRMPLCVRKGEFIIFQNQMMLFQLVPVLALGRQFLGTYKSKQLALTDDLRQSLYLKLAKISAIKTFEITVRWERRLVSKEDLIEDVTMSLQYILKSKKIINKEQAAIIFQPLIYSLKDAVSYLEKNWETDMLIRGINYFSILIDTIIDLVQSFDLTWKDCLETISVLDLACEIVQYEYANYQLSVKFLQLLNVAISRCMSPNMALLMVNTSDAVISKVGYLLYSKCHNRSYQVRKIALEVVRTLALNVTRFPEFTNVLFNAKLPELVLNMALKDREYEVRQIALDALQALILVEDFFEVYQNDDKFWENILNVVINEPNANVRREAVRLVGDIYRYKSFPDFILPRLYDVMTHAALEDNYWEVKRNALRFWGVSIELHLQYQGMTDKSFPKYVFSKEKKKIVNLTKNELRRRAIEALNQLSNAGAFYVFKEALLDEFDEEISKLGRFIAKGLLPLYRGFGITCDDADLDQPPSLNFLCGEQISSISQAESSDNSSSPDRLLKDSQTLNPPFFDIFDLESNPATPDDASLSSPDYSTYSPASTSSMQFSDGSSSSNGAYKSEKDRLMSCVEEDVDNINGNIITMSESDAAINLQIEANNTDDSMSGDEMDETSQLFDDMLKLNDATLLKEIVSNSGFQGKIRTRQYLPPSEYAKICFEISNTNDETSTQFVHLDEFDVLLNELIKEYDLDLTT